MELASQQCDTKLEFGRKPCNSDISSSSGNPMNANPAKWPHFEDWDEHMHAPMKDEAEAWHIKSGFQDACDAHYHAVDPAHFSSRPASRDVSCDRSAGGDLDALQAFSACIDKPGAYSLGHSSSPGLSPRLQYRACSHASDQSHHMRPEGSPLKRARLPTTFERQSSGDIFRLLREGFSAPTTPRFKPQSNPVSPRMSEPHSHCKPEPSAVLASLETHAQMMEMDCESLSQILTNPAKVTGAWQYVTESAFYPPERTNARRGRQPASDPRLQPNIDPRKAARILANRASAARSKEKQRELMASTKAKMQCASFKLEASKKEAELLKTAAEKLEADNQCLDESIAVMQQELLSMENMERGLLRQAAERGLTLPHNIMLDSATAASSHGQMLAQIRPFD